MYEITPLDSQRSNKVTSVPQPPFTTYICSSKGGGKSTLLLNLLTKKEFYKDTFNKIYLISPTASMDEKFNVLKETNIMVPNTNLITLMKKLKSKQKNKIMEDDLTRNSGLSIEDYPRKLTDENFIEEFDINFLQELLDKNKQITNTYNKKFSDKILIVFDDSISNKVFKSKQFEKIVLNSRHFNLSMIIISQSYYLLSKTLRNQNTALCLFDTGNLKELNQIYNENNNGLSWKEFMDIFKDVMKIPYNFLVFNYQNERKFRLQEQFKTFLTIDHET
jgi:hypothetical protein